VNVGELAMNIGCLQRWCLRLKDLQQGVRIEIVGYKGIQFSKPLVLLKGMGFGDPEKTEAAKRELLENGLS
jgi:hypothetical protein